MSVRTRRNNSGDQSAPPRSHQKQRRTFTLSPESVALLDELSAKSKSASAVLDELLLSLRREKVRQEMEERVGRYYDRRSEEERGEEALWGDFATQEFAAIEVAKLRSK
jgi:hypothetical protein